MAFVNNIPMRRVIVCIVQIINMKYVNNLQNKSDSKWAFRGVCTAGWNFSLSIHMSISISITPVNNAYRVVLEHLFILSLKYAYSSRRQIGGY